MNTIVEADDEVENDVGDADVSATLRPQTSSIYSDVAAAGTPTPEPTPQPALARGKAKTKAKAAATATRSSRPNSNANSKGTIDLSSGKGTVLDFSS